MKKVFIDPGHGGKDPGAVGGGLRESDINLSVAKHVVTELKRHNVDVTMSRNTDIDVTLQNRTTNANSKKVDGFVSIHVNSYSDSTAKGVETWCYSSNNLATDIHNSLVIDKSIYSKNRGIKESKTLYVLKNTTMKACLVELGFISNNDDRVLLKNKQKEMAIAISKGILKYLDIKYIEQKTENSSLYIVSVSACKDKTNAERLVKQLKEDGYKDSYIHQCK